MLKLEFLFIAVEISWTGSLTGVLHGVGLGLGHGLVFSAGMVYLYGERYTNLSSNSTYSLYSYVVRNGEHFNTFKGGETFSWGKYGLDPVTYRIIIQ